MVGPLGLALPGGPASLPVVCLGLQLLCFRILSVLTLPMLAVLRSHSEVGYVRDLVYLDFVGRGD